MSDSDKKVISNSEVDADLDIEASTTPITTTFTPDAVLRAFFTRGFTTITPSSSSATGISSPPPPPLPRSPSQHTYIASEILPRLYISDIFTALHPPTLLSLRITHIISVIEYAVTFPTLSKPNAEPKSPVFPGSNLSSRPPLKPISLPPTTLHVRLADLPEADIFSHFATTRDFIGIAFHDENARVLVHCYKGQSRSPTIVAAYLISALKISTSDALKTIKAKRPMVLPNRGFQRQLEQWEVVVREEDEMVCSDR